MSITPLHSRVVILVKALPQPSKKYGETVCCAGLTDEGKWKRLFPIRFRHLSGHQSFSRWETVEFNYRRPHQDSRVESCHVFEDSIRVISQLAVRERALLLNRVLVGSAAEATAKLQSLALIRPRKTTFHYKKKTLSQIESEQLAFQRAASQGSFFDKDLAAIQPSPYRFGFRFEDDDGNHAYQCGDWEVHAMFFNGRKRMGEDGVLKWMMDIFNDKYPNSGMVFALGNMAKRPQTWQLLGVIRLDESKQPELPF